MKKAKRFGGGGRSSYQGNEDSYTQNSDPDAAESVDKGALSRRLAAAAAARAATPASTPAAAPSRDFDVVEAPAPTAAPTTVAVSMPTRPGQDRSGAPMPTRPGQNTSGPPPAPVSSGRKPSVSQAALNAMKDQEIIDRIKGRKKPYMTDEAGNNMKRGGSVKKMASGGSTSSASRRADGIAQRGKTRGKMC
jgi:hypothetical protein